MIIKNPNEASGSSPQPTLSPEPERIAVPVPSIPTSPAPAVPSAPPIPPAPSFSSDAPVPTGAANAEQVSRFLSKKIFIVAGVVLLVLAGFGAWFLAGRDGTSQFSIGKPATDSAKEGDVIETTIFTNSADREIPVRIFVRRIERLVPEQGQSTVGLRFCNETSCYPAQPVQLVADEALVALDLEFEDPSTTTSVQYRDTPYLASQRMRFKVGDKYNPVMSMFENHFQNRMSEQEATLYIYPSKRVKMTFFTRVPKDTEAAEFVYGLDVADPHLRIPLSFSQD